MNDEPLEETQAAWLRWRGVSAGYNTIVKEAFIAGYDAGKQVHQSAMNKPLQCMSSETHESHLLGVQERVRCPGREEGQK